MQHIMRLVSKNILCIYLMTYGFKILNEKDFIYDTFLSIVEVLTLMIIFCYFILHFIFNMPYKDGKNYRNDLYLYLISLKVLVIIAIALMHVVTTLLGSRKNWWKHLKNQTKSRNIVNEVPTCPDLFDVVDLIDNFVLVLEICSLKYNFDYFTGTDPLYSIGWIVKYFILCCSYW